ncbi:hypothetical protein GpartN1_g1103.t1 [Galdieria partita]|uniref:Ammonium transporter n=1 Tax=Galdieria partita TaxID=83374 RepID=A0A9C7PTB7_9RHOD|nr:hypothetical protein GpartN1_g1103.t1 [Galdieria partita]
MSNISSEAVWLAFRDEILRNKTRYEELVNTFFMSKAGGDTCFILVAGFLVFFMHAGFAMLTAGSVRVKNVKNALFLLLIDWAVGSIAYYLFGYAFAFGGEENDVARGFIGQHFFALSGIPSLRKDLEAIPKEASPYLQGSYTYWLFEWSFAITAAAIVSGSVVERVSVEAYCIFSFFMTCWIYPIFEHWAWSRTGWFGALKKDGPLFLGSGYIDFAGSGVVHMVGGIAALWGTIFVGPRIGRFDIDGKPVSMPGHSASLATTGTFVLMFGWYGFNAGSMLGISSSDSYITASRAAVNTTLAPAASMLTAMLYTRIRWDYYDLGASLNAILSGLVAITAPCAVIEPWAAVIVGVIASLIYLHGSKLILRLGIDDPLDAVSVHCLCGTWGVFSTGLFAAEDPRIQAYGTISKDYGAFMGSGGNLLACQTIGILLIWGWVSFNSVILWSLLKCLGIIRVPAEEEMAGMDTSKHGGPAYHSENFEDINNEELQELRGADSLEFSRKDNLGMDNGMSNNLEHSRS